MLNDEIYKQIVAIAIKASTIMMSAKLDVNSITAKEGFSNFVTKYDKEVQHFLIDNFKKILPDAKYLAEEDDVKTNIADGYTFIIDPIDGTTNFIFDRKCSCVSVALTYNGSVIFGVVYDPYLKECYTAIRSQGAFLNGKQIFASKHGLDKNLVSFGMASYYKDNIDKTLTVLKKLFLKCLDLRDNGSATLSLCNIAAGRTGMYVEYTLQPWDYAAASIIIEEAGGIITTIDGGKIPLDKSTTVLAGAAQCHKEAFAIIHDKNNE